MRNQYRLALIISCMGMIGISGCRHADIRPYHSTAFKPRSITQVSTVMEVVDCREHTDHVGTDMGVIVARDTLSSGQSYSYVLIAPLYLQSWSSTSMSNCIVNQGAVIRKEHTSTISQALRQMLNDWNRQIPDSTAEFWEFVSTPQDREYPVSDSVLNTFPTLRFAFNRTANGPNLTVVLSEKTYSFLYVLDKKEALQCLSNKLEEALARLK